MYTTLSDHEIDCFLNCRIVVDLLRVEGQVKTFLKDEAYGTDGLSYGGAESVRCHVSTDDGTAK